MAFGSMVELTCAPSRARDTPLALERRPNNLRNTCTGSCSANRRHEVAPRPWAATLAMSSSAACGYRPSTPMQISARKVFCRGARYCRVFRRIEVDWAAPGGCAACRAEGRPSSPSSDRVHEIGWRTSRDRGTREQRPRSQNDPLPAVARGPEDRRRLPRPSRRCASRDQPANPGSR